MSASLKYDRFLATDCWWRQTRQAALERAGYRCEARVIQRNGVAARCCRPATEIHHQNGYACVGIEKPGDLVALCSDHHRAMHNRKPVPPPANDNQLLLPMNLPVVVKVPSS